MLVTFSPRLDLSQPASGHFVKFCSTQLSYLLNKIEQKSSLALIIIPIFLVLVLMIALGFGFSLFDKDAYFAAVIFVVVVLVICWTVEDKYCKGRGEEFEDEDSGGEGGCGGGGCRGD